jgi:hypothetical protein
VLVAAAVTFGLALGNHSLTLLLAPGVVAYVLAVAPGILRRPRLVLACVGAFVVTVVLVYLELPIRAGLLRAPLVYGHPETWAGFWYVVLAEQFRTSVLSPWAEPGATFADLARRAYDAFGLLAILIPVGFVATALARPRYALLTGLSLVITCVFAVSYVNAEIARYYLGPALIAWTWLAILGGMLVDALVGVDETRFGAARATPSPARLGVTAVVGAALLIPTALDLPARHRAVDRSRDRAAEVWVDRALDVMEQDALVVSWWSYSTPLWYAQLVEGRRPDVAIIDDRTRLDRGLGGITDVIDANLRRRPVYVIRRDPAEVALLEERYVLEPIDGSDASSLTRVVARRDAGA